jgi:hypothetical protein
LVFNAILNFDHLKKEAKAEVPAAK